MHSSKEILSADNSHKKVIIVADDEELNRMVLVELLSDWPFTCIEAENGAIAIELAKQHKPALILMDLRMPIMNGSEAIQILKASDGTSDIPIIAITGGVAGIFPIELGFSAVLDKPITKKKLDMTLNQLL